MERAASLVWPAHQAPLLAGVAALALALLARAARRPGLAVGAGPLGIAVGWAVLTAASSGPRAVLAPRGLAEHLVLPALLTLAAAVALPLARARWAAAGWMLLGAAVAWWLAGSPAGRAEFWRVGAVVTLLAWGMAWAAGRDAARATAAAFALWGALLAVGASSAWLGTASVVAAAALGGLAARPTPPALGSAVLIATAMAAASLGGGRLVRGRIGAVDVACLAAAVAPWLVRPLAVRIPRAAWLAPPAAAAMAAGVAWAVVRFTPLR